MKEITNDLKAIHKYTLEILEYIHKICVSNNIKYSLDGGTLIGAIRHKGFIPWDDDADIFMPRPDYDRFINIITNDQNKYFKCLNFGITKNYFYPFAKIVNLKTKLKEGDFIEPDDLGVHVDVFPYDAVSNNFLNLRIKHIKKLRSCCSLAASKKIQKSRSLIKNIFKHITFPLLKLIGWKFWAKKTNNFLKRIKYEKSDYIMAYTGINYKRTIIPKNYFDDIICIDFEDKQFNIINQYDKYLTSIYGDYMTPPPLQNQIKKHNTTVWEK